MIEAILFDLDWTLYDYDSVNESALKRSWEVMREAVDIPYKQFLRLRDEAKRLISNEIAGGMRHDKYLQFQVMLEELGIFDGRLVLDMGDAYWKETFRLMKRDDRLVKLFRRLSKRFRIGIVTNLYLEVQLKKMKKLGIIDHVDSVVTSEEIEMEKPSRLLFMVAAQKLMLLPNRCVFVGDTVGDMYGAFSVGMRTISVGKKLEYAELHVPDIYAVEHAIERLL